MSETLAFRMHPHLLWDVIHRQAGTLQKAIGEAIMNAIDAQSTRCDITVTREAVTIRDDGRGLGSREDIERFWATFGQPHKAGDAVYGRYRMGRGQLFAFGANVWRSGPHRLRVDLKPQESTADDATLTFRLDTLEEEQSGCVIEIALYEPLKPSSIEALEREIKNFAEWAPIALFVNGQRVNKSVAEMKWTIETDEAYIALKDTQSIKLYNLGVFVDAIPAGRFGVGGIVVSKKALDVNFARNQVVSTCKVWGAIARRIEKDAGLAKRKKTKLNEAEIQSIVHQILIGEADLVEERTTKLFECVDRTRLSLDALKSRLDNMAGIRPVGVADISDRAAVRVHESRIATIFSRTTLDLFDVSDPVALIARIAKLVSRRGKHGDHERFALAHTFDKQHFRHIEASEISALVPDDMEEVPTPRLTAKEKIALEVWQSGAYRMGHLFDRYLSASRNTLRLQDSTSDWSAPFVARLSGRKSALREVRAGRSEVADAWTDGDRFVWIERRHLELVWRGVPGLTRLAQLTLHELLHDAPDTDTHVHDQEFYELYHDLAIDTPLIGEAVDYAMQRLTRVLERENRKAPGVLKRTIDNTSVLEHYGIGAAIAATEPAPDAHADVAPGEATQTPRAARRRNRKGPETKS